MTDARRPVALVLGAAVWPGGVASPSLSRRALHAADLWHAGHIGAIIASGGEGRHGPAEAEVIAGLCHAAGVAPEALHLEPRATTTEENIRLSLPLLEALGHPPVVLVTERYHAPRALLVARRAGLSARADWPPATPLPSRRALSLRLREAGAFAWYALAGKGR
ncbi:YdcF family protein [Pseudoponticoccus marisrubri]|uniref:DUF218 domain-containing protein n=1 Tax=Pseudoponticoccus marisrubri TaxID=1685382 RepID=A0A0W7WGP5_9RHOB|nr:YdcF family protein [Pseudoponticoccus marisrubri]KUF09788.1 hypothetical protein AVJ23_15160 [Pseudoponticoccus marisrubri]